jgi:2-oxo-4-hydroxy-4-carboxy-5-ureidoimidazoline decarboxylase
LNETCSLEELNQAPLEETRQALFRCCGCTPWSQALAEARPFESLVDLLAKADRAWASLPFSEQREAFLHHPRIGDRESLRKKFAATAGWSEQEQAGVSGAQEAVLDGLERGNRDYEARFGHIFLICATGKSAAEMLSALQARIKNDSSTEARIAAEEQRKITHLRLKKLLGG